jgi:DNA-binding response OmpR family regulator
VTTPVKILIVDDDPMIEKMLRPHLEHEQFLTLAAKSVDEAVPVIERERPQLIVLDLTMPGKNGLDLLRTLNGHSDTAVIVLTGRADELDRIIGLELGADDYVTKPFSPREVLSRIKAVLRRAATRAPKDGAPPERHKIAVGDLSIDLRERSVTVAGREIALTPTEFRILEVLASEPGRAFSRAELLDRVNADALDVGERTLDSHIRHLRQKLEPDGSQPRYVLTVFGFGYKFNKAPKLAALS